MARVRDEIIVWFRCLVLIALYEIKHVVKNAIVLVLCALSSWHLVCCLDLLSDVSSCCRWSLGASFFGPQLNSLSPWHVVV